MNTVTDTDTVRKVHVENSKAFLADILKALDDDEEFALFKDGEPVARVVPVSQVVARSENYFKHYPHDPGECLYTCWRHPRTLADAGSESVPSGSDAPLENKSQE